MEIELVERARTGDRAAFEAVIVAASSRLMGIALRPIRPVTSLLRLQPAPGQVLKRM